MDAEKFDFDLYEHLKVDESAELSEIQKSYRRLCLTCHPDKYPDRQDQFLKLTAVLDFLSDPTKRKAYDAKRKAKKIHLKRKLEADSKTKKFRDELEERENKIKKQKKDQEEAMEIQREVNRLREEGLRKIEEEKERQRKEDVETRKKQQEMDSLVIARWSKEDNYSEALLRSVFQQYGTIQSFIIRQKGNSALIQYPNASIAAKAIEGLQNQTYYNFTVSSGGQTGSKKPRSQPTEKTYYEATHKTEHVAQAEMLSAHSNFEAEILAKMMEFGGQPEPMKID